MKRTKYIVQHVKLKRDHSSGLSHCFKWNIGAYQTLCTPIPVDTNTALMNQYQVIISAHWYIGQALYKMSIFFCVPLLIVSDIFFIIAKCSSIRGIISAVRGHGSRDSAVWARPESVHATFINTERAAASLTPRPLQRSSFNIYSAAQLKDFIASKWAKKGSKKLGAAHFHSLWSAKQKRKRGGMDGEGGELKILTRRGGYPLSAVFFFFSKGCWGPPTPLQ